MSKKMDLKKLAQLAKAKCMTLTGKKGIHIGEKWAREEMPDISPVKKGKHVVDAKKKGSMLPPDDKKKGPAAKAPAKSKATPSRAAT